MKKRRLYILVLAMVAVVAVLVVVFHREREPEYGGKRLSEWVERYATRATETEFNRAIREIGTNAIPFLLDWIRFEAPAWRIKTYAAVNAILGRINPSWQLTETKHERRALGAMYGFIALGSQAKGKIGELKLLVDKPRGQQSAALASVALVHLGGSRLFAPIPPKMLPELWVPSAPTPPSSAYYTLLRSDSPPVRIQAIEDLQWAGDNALFAVPSLIECLQDKNPDIVRAASNAIRRIYPAALKQATTK